MSRSACPVANHWQKRLSVITGWVIRSRLQVVDEGAEALGLHRRDFAAGDAGLDLIGYFQSHAGPPRQMSANRRRIRQSEPGTGRSAATSIDTGNRMKHDTMTRL